MRYSHPRLHLGHKNICQHSTSLQMWSVKHLTHWAWKWNLDSPSKLAENSPSQLRKSGAWNTSVTIAWQSDTKFKGLVHPCSLLPSLWVVKKVPGHRQKFSTRWRPGWGQDWISCNPASLSPSGFKALRPSLCPSTQYKCPCLTKSLQTRRSCPGHNSQTIQFFYFFNTHINQQRAVNDKESSTLSVLGLWSELRTINMVKATIFDSNTLLLSLCTAHEIWSNVVGVLFMQFFFRT